VFRKKVVRVFLLCSVHVRVIGWARPVRGRRFQVSGPAIVEEASQDDIVGLECSRLADLGGCADSHPRDSNPIDRFLSRLHTRKIDFVDRTFHVHVVLAAGSNGKSFSGLATLGKYRLRLAEYFCFRWKVLKRESATVTHPIRYV